MKLWMRGWRLGHPWYAFDYRCDPVPETGGWSWRSYYRKFRTTQERRALGDPDHKRYSRARRHCLPDPWNAEIVKEKQKGWKFCTKRRRQWERR